MKKITITFPVTLPYDVFRWLRVKAAEDERSVSKWICELLERRRHREDEYEIAMERYLARRPRKIHWAEGRRPTREQLHDRSRLR